MKKIALSPVEAETLVDIVNDEIVRCKMASIVRHESEKEWFEKHIPYLEELKIKLIEIINPHIDKAKGAKNETASSQRPS